MYDALKDEAEVELFNTDENRRALDTKGRRYDYGTTGPVYIKYNKVKRIIKKFQPDIILCVAGGLSFRERDINKLKDYKLICITLSDPDVFKPATEKIAKNFDLVYTNAKLSIDDYKRIGVAAKLMPFAGNAKFHKRMKPLKKYETDLLFIGNYREDRVNLLKDLIGKYKIDIYGSGWERADIKSKGFIEGEEMIKVINSAKICLDFPQTMAGYQNVKFRLFEYGCCGAVILTGKLTEIEKYFSYDREIVGFKSKDEFHEKVDKLLSDEKYRKSIGDNMFKKCQSEHTYQKRFQEMLRDVEKI